MSYFKILEGVKEVRLTDRQWEEEKWTETEGEKQMRDGNRLLLPAKCQWNPGDALINLSNLPSPPPPLTEGKHTDWWYTDGQTGQLCINMPRRSWMREAIRAIFNWKFKSTGWWLRFNWKGYENCDQWQISLFLSLFFSPFFFFTSEIAPFYTFWYLGDNKNESMMKPSVLSKINVISTQLNFLLSSI